MSMKACLRHAAGLHVECLQRGTWLPFLYCTRTIRRRQYSEVAFNHEPARSNSSEESGESRGIPNKTSDAGRPHRTEERSPQRGRDRYGRGGKPIRRAQHTPLRDWHSSKEQHIPFEIAVPEAAPEPAARSEESTVTQFEESVFQSLLDMKKRREMKSKKPAERSNVPSLESLLKISHEKKPKPDDTTATAPTTPRKEQEETPASLLQNKINAELNTVKSLMRDARTDARLWNIFHTNVLARVEALRLDAPPVSSEPPGKKASKSKGPKPKEPAPLPADGDDLQILTQTFPKHLLNFHSILGASFPSSPFGLALLPHVRRLGPTAFALGASTDLYNNHLRLLFSQHLDLQAIVDTLEDMDRQVYDFDSGTHDVLMSVLHRAAQAREYDDGESLKAVWSSERMSNALRKIYNWSRKVEEHVQERALQEARSTASEAGQWLESNSG